MINWIKNLYKGDNSMSYPITLVLVFTVYWFTSNALKYGIAAPFMFSKHVYDFVLPFIIIFIIFRIIFVKTRSIQRWIENKNRFLMGIISIAWIAGILYSWAYVDFYLPKITTKIIYKTSDLPRYVIDPCSYWSNDDYWNGTYTLWTKEEEKEALLFWRYKHGGSFHNKCTPNESSDSD